jgi:hypothetical protein
MLLTLILQDSSQENLRVVFLSTPPTVVSVIRGKPQCGDHEVLEVRKHFCRRVSLAEIEQNIKEWEVGHT